MYFFNSVIYHIKTNIHRYLSFLFSSCVLCLIFYFFVPTTIVDYSNYRRLTNTSFSEIWFTQIAAKGDCYLSLNGNTFIITNDNKSLNVDIFMQLNSSNYQEDFFSFNVKLNEGECVISKNIAKKYNLSKGDELNCKLYDNKIIIKNIIDSYEGIDNKYYHEGICILGFTSDLVPKNNQHFVTFTSGTDGLMNVERIIFLENRINVLKTNVLENILFFSGFCCIMCIAEELLIFKKKVKDYKIDIYDGKKKGTIFISMIFDSFIKYIVPFLIGILFLASYSEMYVFGYLFMLYIGLATMSVISIIISIVYYLGVTYGKKSSIRN